MWISRYLLILALVLVALSAAPLRAQDRKAEIKKLLKERSELLDETLNGMLDQYLLGTVTVVDMLSTQREAVRARLVLHESPKDRAKALRESAAIAKATVKLVEDKLKAQVARRVDFSRARAAYLEIQIELLRLEQKMAEAGRRDR